MIDQMMRVRNTGGPTGGVAWIENMLSIVFDENGFTKKHVQELIFLLMPMSF